MEKYNKYHFPEAKVEIIKIEQGIIVLHAELMITSKILSIY